GRDDPRRHARSFAADSRPSACVRVVVELEPKPGRVAAHPGPDRGGMLADPSREHERVEPAERRGERAKLTSDSIDEKVDGLCGLRARACEKYLHIARDARDAKEPGFFIEQFF